MTNVLITGITGSLGNALALPFLNLGYNITGLSRDPHKQTVMAARYPDIRFVLGDICDRDLMLDLCENTDILIHAAALKIVGNAQTNAKEYYRVNVIGALTAAEAAYTCGVDKAILISSDKACSPAQQIYGKTKAMAEGLWLAKNTDYRSTAFAAVRYGNVVISNGSVWHVWQKCKAEGKPITVKYPNPTRFILTMNQAVWLVMQSLDTMSGGEIFVPCEVPAFDLFDLARQFEPDEEKWIKTPLLPGEKQHEIMVAPTEYARPANLSVRSFDGIELWCVDSNKTQIYQVTPPKFSSYFAKRISGAEVVEKLTNAN